MKSVFLGLGSNLGNKKQNLEIAIKYLTRHTCIKVKETSSFIETNPVSFISQPKFLNAVLRIETSLHPKELLTVTEDIEKKMGRITKGTYGPRNIDIDILLYGQDIVCANNLLIPHPLMHERSFVLIPLKELSPDLIHPTLQEPISSIYDKVVGY